MSLFNILWFIFFGWLNALIVLILSGFMALTIIGSPIAKSLLQFSKLSLFPYGKEVIREKNLKGKSNALSVRKKIGGIFANIIWFPLGLFLTVAYLLLGIIMTLTIIGKPTGIVYMKMGKFILMPIGTRVIFQKKPLSSSTIENKSEKKEKLKDALKVSNI